MGTHPTKPEQDHKSVIEFIHACIRAYIDETGDIIGSRKHFSNHLNERMDRLGAMQLWNALHSQVLTARNELLVSRRVCQLFASNHR